MKCACEPCPANRGKPCECGLFWYDGDHKPHCGVHDPNPVAQYVCECGHRFPFSLGKYGCPNCDGDKAATIRRHVSR